MPRRGFSRSGVKLSVGSTGGLADVVFCDMFAIAQSGGAGARTAEEGSTPDVAGPTAAPGQPGEGKKPSSAGRRSCVL